MEALSARPSGTPLLILGGGSNLLFTSDFDGLVLKPDLKGVRILEKEKNFVLIEASAGESWDSIVKRTVEQGWGGIENLSFIPGTVGASPVQNIGAYGVEVKDTLHSVTYIGLDDMKQHTLLPHECRFGYRQSIFKQELKGKALVTSVTFRLQMEPSLVTRYGNVGEELKKYPERSVRTVREAIIAIRSRKLPDPAVVGNAGSFFKNPVIPLNEFVLFHEKNPSAPFYEVEGKRFKIPAAWLIEACGWKGYREGDAGVHSTQPLVLVNYGKSKGNEILRLANRICESVKERFNILLEKEVNIIESA